MYIYIDKSYSGSFSEIELTALDNLATAILEGNHLIFWHKDFIVNLDKSCVSEKIKTAFISTDYNGSFYLQACQYFSTIVYVTKSNSSLCDFPVQNPIKVDLSFFRQSESIQVTELLCENVIDASFIVKTALTYLKYNKINSLISIQHLPVLGGGDTTAELLCEKSKRGRRFCLCVVDSDKKIPDINNGQTSRKVQNSKDLNCNVAFHILNSHEIENLIPTAILEDIDGLNFQIIQALLLILNDKTASILYKYLDIKNGLKYGDACKMKIGSIQYKKEVEKLLNLNQGHCSNDLKCNDGSFCQDCHNFIINGLGNSILQKAVDKLDKLTPQKLLEIINKQLLDEWLDVGKLVSSWCCATGQHKSYF